MKTSDKPRSFLQHTYWLLFLNFQIHKVSYTVKLQLILIYNFHLNLALLIVFQESQLLFVDYYYHHYQDIRFLHLFLYQIQIHYLLQLRKNFWSFIHPFLLEHCIYILFLQNFLYMLIFMQVKHNFAFVWLKIEVNYYSY